MRLTCSGIGVSYETSGKVVEVLRNVAFTVGEGEFLAIVGPSGCGKTTLLRTLAGLLQPRSGAIDLQDASADGSARVLMVFQDHGLFPWMTVAENAAFGLETQGVALGERRRAATELLARLGLAGRESAYPHELSAGMKQRVAVARSFLSNPAVLLMDEPFAALDAQTRLQLQEELLALWEQSHRSVVFVTHDIDEAVLLSDRILVMSRQPGTIIAEHEVPFDRPRSPAGTLNEDYLKLKAMVLRQLGMDTERIDAR
jgi:NitT/TauT family transport system ATP-binding protein